jgi:3-deoxy-manno-octulosonate cytidylyltransferase (CMP-KDO synthetase)
MNITKPQVVGIIPARFDSNRFPGKPLALIAGKPMIQHVVERAQAVPALSRVVVATDDQRIARAV